MANLKRILTAPLTVPGAILGLVYLALTGKHPSVRVLMILGACGLALILFAIASTLVRVTPS